MFKDTHLKVIEIKYIRDTKQQSYRVVLMINIADSVPSISRFLGYNSMVELRSWLEWLPVIAGGNGSNSQINKYDN